MGLQKVLVRNQTAQILENFNGLTKNLRSLEHESQVGSHHAARTNRTW